MECGLPSLDESHYPGNRELRRLVPHIPNMEAQTIASALKPAITGNGSGLITAQADTPHVRLK